MNENNSNNGETEGRIQPHWDKIQKACDNEKCTEADIAVLGTLSEEYEQWKRNLSGLDSTGKRRVFEMVELLNDYKNKVALAVVTEKEASFLRRQKGQLKIESSITEEFLVELMNPNVISKLGDAEYVTGPRDALLSLSFTPSDFTQLGKTPGVNIEKKAQDFTIGTNIFYKFSPSSDFPSSKSEEGEFTLAVLAAECKRHLDKTMYRESVGTAAQLKRYIPFSKYYIITDFLDMTPANPKVTALDNVYILRRASRLPYGKRKDPNVVKSHLENNPISKEVVWKFVKEIKRFLSATWFEPGTAVERGSFI